MLHTLNHLLCNRGMTDDHRSSFQNFEQAALVFLCMAESIREPRALQSWRYARYACLIALNAISCLGHRTARKVIEHCNWHTQDLWLKIWWFTNHSLSAWYMSHQLPLRFTDINCKRIFFLQQRVKRRTTSDYSSNNDGYAYCTVIERFPASTFILSPSGNLSSLQVLPFNE